MLIADMRGFFFCPSDVNGLLLLSSSLMSSTGVARRTRPTACDEALFASCSELAAPSLLARRRLCCRDLPPYSPACGALEATPDWGSRSVRTSTSFVLLLGPATLTRSSAMQCVAQGGCQGARPQHQTRMKLGGP